MKTDSPHLVRAMVCAILGACALVYANTLQGEFVWDDASSILLHEHVQDPASMAKLFTEDQHAFAGGQGNFYRPLVAVTFLVDFWLANDGPTITESDQVITGLGPFIFHLDSILWHALACIALLIVLGNLNASTPVRIAAPLLYAVHPLHTEAVTYISGRADSMSAAFILAGLSIATLQTSKRPLLISVLTLMCFIAGLLSKESTLIFPILLVMTLWITNRIHDQKWSMPQWATLAGSAIILILYGILRSGPLSFASDSTPPSSGMGVRFTETLQSFAHYITLLVLPRDLHMERTLSDATTMTTVMGALFLALIIAGGLAALRFKQHRVALGAGWFLASWLPISGLFPLNAPMAEHWMYVPMVGFLLLVLVPLFEMMPSTRSEAAHSRRALVSGIVVTAWGISLVLVSVNRNADWRNNTSIYEATIRENPDTTRVHYNLAVTYEDLVANPVGAKRHYQAIIDAYAKRKADDPELGDQFWDEEIQSHLSLGQLFLDDGQFGQAVEHFQTVASIAPDERNRINVGLAFFGLGQCVMSRGDREQATRLFNQAAQLVPELQPEIDILL